MTEGHRLTALQVGVARHQRVGLGLGEREDHEAERVDLLPGFAAGVEHVQPERGGDLVVSRAARVDLPSDRPELALDRRVDVLVVREVPGRVAPDGRQPLLCVGELLVAEQPGSMEPLGVLEGRLAVVREQLGVVAAEELPHGRVERSLRPS